MSINYNVEGQQGYMQLSVSNGAVVNSGGDLQNDEKTAKIIYNIVKSTSQVEKVKTISVNFQSSCYVIVLSGTKIHVVKKESLSDM